MPLPETSLIARIRRQTRSIRRARKSAALAVGIGDDCAVVNLPPGEQLLVTTDFTLEKVHFRREWHPPQAVGHRCLARGLSDIAAMGGEPIAAFLSIALPRDLPQAWVDQFMVGFLRLAKQFRAPLSGGDTAESASGILADVMALGRVPAGKALLRSGARADDAIYVTGTLGASVATLEQLRRERPARPKPIRSGPARAHYFPTPRIAVGRELRRGRIASAAIDISDGFSTDLAHICKESGVGGVVYEQAIPRSRIATLAQALHGGEDYELIFTASPRVRVPARIAGVPVRRVGEIIRGNRIWIVDERGRRSPLQPRGWEHFSR